MSQVTTTISSTPGDPGNGNAGGKDRSGGTSFDTILGRVVVEQGLVTPEEVQLCLEQQRQRVEDEKEKTLSALLVENQFITSRQLDRLRKEVDAQRSTQQIPGYVIKRMLGAGAMAKVHLGKQISLDRLVAIKTLPKKFSSNPQFIERFYQEGRTAAKLNHPNIVQAYDVGKAGEYHYFVMEYVDGKTVYDDIVSRGKYDERDAIDIVLQIADALQHAHKAGLIHRDVKPKNLMLTREGVAKLADMGLARAVSDKEMAEAEKGRAFGTPYYISPEQIRGEVNIGPQADIYSLGATFYHMVTGKVPFDGENPSAVMHKHLKQDLIPPDHVNPKLSPGCAEVIEMMMAKSRRKRYQSCADVISDLRLVREGKAPIIARKDVDLTGLASGMELPEPLPNANGTTTVMNSPVGSGSSIFGHPAFIVMAVLLGLSALINLFLLLSAAN